MSLPPNSIDQNELDALPPLPPFDARSYIQSHVEKEHTYGERKMKSFLQSTTVLSLPQLIILLSHTKYTHHSKNPKNLLQGWHHAQGLRSWCNIRLRRTSSIAILRNS